MFTLISDVIADNLFLFRVLGSILIFVLFWAFKGTITKTVVKLLTVAKLAASNKEAKTLIKQGGVQVNGEKVDDFSAAYVADQFAGDGLVLKKGKKVYRRFLLK